jgi:hypothetical protein
MTEPADLLQLLRLAADPPGSPIRVDPDQARRQWRRHHVVRTAMSAVTALVLIAAVAVPVAVSRSERTHAPVAAATAPSPGAIPYGPTVAQASGATAVQLARGHWSPLPAAPIPERQEASVVWTGHELLVWGGQSTTNTNTLLSDGAAYDPVTGRWRPLAASPLSPRTEQSVVWTGTEMIIWGGYTRVSPSFAIASDGAAYDPTSNTWRTLPPSPLTARHSATAVWTGASMVILGGQPAIHTATDQSLADGAAYDPTTDAWQLLPDAAAPPHHAIDWLAVAQTGSQLLAWSSWTSTHEISPNTFSTTGGIDVFSLNEANGRWRVVPGAASRTPAPGQVFTVGSTVVVNGTGCGGLCASAGPPGAATVASYSAATNRWRDFPPDPLAITRPRLIAAGTTLFAFNATAHFGNITPGASSLYDEVSQRWTRLPNAPAGCADSTPGAAWTGAQVLIYCTPFGGDLGSAGLIFTSAAA